MKREKNQNPNDKIEIIFKPIKVHEKCYNILFFERCAIKFQLIKTCDLYSFRWYTKNSLEIYSAVLCSVNSLHFIPGKFPNANEFIQISITQTHSHSKPHFN